MDEEFVESGGRVVQKRRGLIQRLGQAGGTADGDSAERMPMVGEFRVNA